MPKMTHPDLPDRVIEVHPRQVRLRERAGWKQAVDTVAATGSTVDPKTSTASAAKKADSDKKES